MPPPATTMPLLLPAGPTMPASSRCRWYRVAMRQRLTNDDSRDKMSVDTTYRLPAERPWHVYCTQYRSLRMNQEGEGGRGE
jgi:hypothetical protein